METIDVADLKIEVYDGEPPVLHLVQNGNVVALRSNQIADLRDALARAHWIAAMMAHWITAPIHISDNNEPL